MLCRSGLWHRPGMERMANKSQNSSLSIEETHTSVWLQRLVDEAPKKSFTLNWLIGHLPKHSFGIILLFLALISTLPVISIPARLLILVLLLQIIFGYHSPVLPGWLVNRPLPARYLTRLNRHAIPALQYFEKIVRPRWLLLFRHTRRIIAFIAALLTILSLFAPFPLANVPPAVISVLIALAYIEHDGLTLTIALFFALLLLVIVSAVILQAALA